MHPGLEGTPCTHQVAGEVLVNSRVITRVEQKRPPWTPWAAGHLMPLPVLLLLSPSLERLLPGQDSTSASHRLALSDPWGRDRGAPRGTQRGPGLPHSPSPGWLCGPGPVPCEQKVERAVPSARPRARTAHSAAISVCVSFQTGIRQQKRQTSLSVSTWPSLSVSSAQESWLMSVWVTNGPLGFHTGARLRSEQM